MKITPNQITVSRIILIPFIIFFYMATFVPYGKIIATSLFVIACLTDFLDGYLARKYNMVSNLGKFLDSIADKLLVVCALILIVADATISSPYGAIAFCIIIAREFIVSALRQMAAAKNIVIQADMWGKVKANFQFFAIMFFMVLSFMIDNKTKIDQTFFTIFEIACYTLLGICVVATIISGLHYLIKHKQVFTDVKKLDTEQTDAKK